MRNLDQNKFITEKVRETVLWVNTLFKGKVSFCGSFGLVFNGKLKRQIKDIDCITDVDHYGKRFYDMFVQYGTKASNSEKFKVNGVEVRCFQIHCPNGMDVDVMFRDGRKLKTKKHYLINTQIKVEEPESVITIKEEYLKRLNEDPTLTQFNPMAIKKHQSDIDFITGK